MNPGGVIVLSDTHVMTPSRRLPDKLIADLEQADLILHAGDIAVPEFLELLRGFAPVEAVHGNADLVDLQHVLPTRVRLEVLGRPVGLVHGHVGPGASTVGRARMAFAGAPVDVIVFGHSHMPYREYSEETLLFNPGSPTERRMSPRFSYGKLVLREDGRLTAGHVWL